MLRRPGPYHMTPARGCMPSQYGDIVEITNQEVLKGMYTTLRVMRSIKK